MKIHKLHQVHTSSGINFHRAWECSLCGKAVVSNDDIVGDSNKFRLDKGEGSKTVWFKSARAAIESVPCI